MSSIPNEVHEALDKMKDNIRTLGGIIKQQDATINELKETVADLKSNSSGRKTGGNRKVHDDPEKIALVLHLLNRRGYSIKAATDTGLLSYSKTYGVYGWDVDYYTQWLEDRDLVDLFEEPLEHSEWAKENEEYFT